MIQVILFDFYGVFVADPYDDWLTRNNLKREGVFARLIGKRDRGELDEHDFLRHLSQTVGRPVTQADIHNPSVAPLNNELVELVQKLKLHYRVGLFSNASVNLRSKLTGLGIAELFDEVIISGEIGYAKPADQAFNAAIARLDTTNPGDILFIDDNITNVAAAARNGLASIHYTSLTTLRIDLQYADIELP